MTTRWADRTVSGQGQFGLASGGASGDGDVQMFRTAESAKGKAQDWLRDALTQLRRFGYMTEDEFTRALKSGLDQLDTWNSSEQGSVVDVVVPTPIMDAKLAVFKCSFQAVMENGVFMGNAWVIPFQIRIPDEKKRRIKMVEKTSKKGRR